MYLVGNKQTKKIRKPHEIPNVSDTAAREHFHLKKKNKPKKMKFDSFVGFHGGGCRRCC